jgi:hypothetical protein
MPAMSIEAMRWPAIGSRSSCRATMLETWRK